MTAGRISSPRPLIQSAGLHTLSGTTTVAGNPDVVSPRQLVQVLRAKQDTRLLAQTLSDARGIWRIDGIAARAPGRGYTAIAYDGSGTYDPAAKENLVPSPLPPDPSEHGG